MKDHQEISMFESDEAPYQRPPLLLKRLLVVMLYLSFIACLVALWLTNTIFGNPSLPDWLIQAIASNRNAILIAPLVCLMTCYLTMRHVTSEIMACPERYLDERQKMVRDQAHRYAYRIIKLACLLVPLFFCLHNMLSPTQPGFVPASLAPIRPMAISGSIVIVRPDQPVNMSPIALTVYMDQTTSHITNLNPVPGETMIWAPAHPGTMTYPPAPFKDLQQPAPISPTLWPNDPASMALYYGTLLLCLFLMASVLPMTIVAWKGRS
jgi:hypothetical protein